MAGRAKLPLTVACSPSPSHAPSSSTCLQALLQAQACLSHPLQTSLIGARAAAHSRHLGLQLPEPAGRMKAAWGSNRAARHCMEPTLRLQADDRGKGMQASSRKAACQLLAGTVQQGQLHFVAVHLAVLPHRASMSTSSTLPSTSSLMRASSSVCCGTEAADGRRCCERGAWQHPHSSASGRHSGALACALKQASWQAQPAHPLLCVCVC